MAEYICHDCGALFYEPVRVQEPHPGCDGGGRTMEEWAGCPFCRSIHFHAVKPCPGCGAYMEADRKLCQLCSHDLRGKLRKFIGALSWPEKEALDDWTDGASILDVADMEDEA